MNTTEQENLRATKELRGLNDKIYELTEYYLDRGQHNAAHYLTPASDSIEALIKLHETDDDYLNR